ncbi:MAG: patatin-like phospholipase family protein [Brachymonas sp.]|nr:patatin-like phospholipase family protein [Brachymonas sp.]
MPNHSSPKRVSLALQGGGSHGAFTWGVLDALLEDGRMKIDGVSGASAGAMNAVALGHGFAAADRAGANEAARASLALLWQRVARLGEASKLQRGMMDLWLSGWKATGAALSPQLSPYQANPLDINPLRKLVQELIDFPKLVELDVPRIFVSATHVATGKAEIFSGKRLTDDAVMASACLPMLFRAVEIEGQHYWDGGFSGNPALHPLIYQCKSSDIVLIQINPIERSTLPDTGAEIMDRINELTFNASLLGQMRSIDFVNRLIDKGHLPPERYRTVRLHRIDGGEALEALPASSKSSADGALIDKLFDLGRLCATKWLKKNFDEVGVKTTINISKDYLDDMRLGHPADR